MKQVRQFTSRSDFWNTPKKLYETIISKGYVDYNPTNSLIVPFDSQTTQFHNKKVYINPPFSLLSEPEFVSTIHKLILNGNEVLLLIPSRTDTKYFHKLLEFMPRVYFVKGRLKFNDTGYAPFPSVFLHFTKTNDNSYRPFDIDLI